MTPEGFEFWHRIVNEHCIARCSGSIEWLDRKFINLDRLFLSLSAVGDRVDFVVSVAFP